MPIKLYDTLRQQVLPFEPAEPGHVRLYVCGPTVYDYAHGGHMRANIVYDVMIRLFRERGLRVTYVRNVTDVDDRIIQRANQAGETAAAFAARLTASYVEDTRRLGSLDPDVQPKVSEHVPEIVALIEALIARGAAYESQGDVYFSVKSFPAYGKLSHRKLEDMESGASGRVADEEAQRKQNPADFALWKAAKPGEPSWPSAWGPGRPGWHIECSAMAMKHLGASFDVHGGGLDLIFPHHENEIAQSEAATGQDLARFWVHNGFIEVNREKMSKSVGNFFTARECFRFAEPEAMRYFMLTAHYRAPLDFDFELDDAGHVRSFPQFDEAERRVEYVYATRLRVAGLGPERIDPSGTKPEPELTAFPEQLARSLEEDLNFPASLAVVADFLKRVNDAVDVASRKQGKLSGVAQRSIEAGFAALTRVLGIGHDQPREFLSRVRTRRIQAVGLDAAEVERRIAERIEARKQKQFGRADEIRDALLAVGVELMDGVQGTDWRVR
jgi:cysteinyl-tRNA synthetase